jgi:transcriptional regulator with XRE-family HTH domain
MLCVTHYSLQLMKFITKRLRVLRAGKGWTQLEAARRTGIKFYRFQRIESGLFDVTPEEAEAIEKAFALESGRLMNPEAASVAS